MFANEILVAYAEIALKSSRVRRRFVRKLVANIRSALSGAGFIGAYQRGGRVLLRVDDIKASLDPLSRVFGIAFYAPVVHIPLSELKAFVKENAPSLLGGARTFAVDAVREGIHPFTSIDIEREIGRIVAEETGAKVDLKHPERTVYVEVRGDDAYVYNERWPGPGGLPLGTAGRVVCLISGGIDSPVAAWMMMKRGCPIVPLFAHFPKGGNESDLARFVDVVRALGEWSAGEPMPVYIFRHEHNLAVFRKHAGKYTCVLCKRMMYRVANALAERAGALAIVTGESLAQVASQTLHNLRVIDEASELPVLRPLIGFDKLESERLAKRIGTYEISIRRVSTGCQPGRGCWARPPKPATRADLDTIKKIESEIGVNNLLEQSVATLREITKLVFG